MNNFVTGIIFFSYNKIYNERKSVINDLLGKEMSLCKDLGFKQKGLSTSPTLPSGHDIEVFQKYLFDLEQEKSLRQTELEKMRKDLIRIFGK